MRDRAAGDAELTDHPLTESIVAATCPLTLDEAVNQASRYGVSQRKPYPSDLSDADCALTSPFRLRATAVEADIRKCLPDLGR